MFWRICTWIGIGIGTFDGCWMRGLLEELFSHDPNLLGRQFVQGFPAFTQAHPLQEPVLLHLQHGICSESTPTRNYNLRSICGITHSLRTTFLVVRTLYAPFLCSTHSLPTVLVVQHTLRTVFVVLRTPYAPPFWLYALSTHCILVLRILYAPHWGSTHSLHTAFFVVRTLNPPCLW